MSDPQRPEREAIERLIRPLNEAWARATHYPTPGFIDGQMARSRGLADFLNHIQVVWPKLSALLAALPPTPTQGEVMTPHDWATVPDAGVPSQQYCRRCKVLKLTAEHTRGFSTRPNEHDGCPAEHAPVAPRTPTPTPGWQDISTAPKDGTEVLLHWPHWSRRATIGYWKHDRWIAENALDGSETGPQPVAWMPLPPAPTGERE
jgi:hypothetical protein